MGFQQSHREIEELLAAYALDAVEADEREAIERHLVDCDSCGLEVGQHRAVTASLVSPVATAPRELWDRIVAALEETPPPLELAPIVSRGRQRTHTARVFAAGAAVAAIAVAVLGVRLVDHERRIDQFQTAMAKNNLERSALFAVNNPTAKKVELRSPFGNATGQVATLVDGRGYLVADGLPNLAADRTYQLWALVDGQRISAGTLGTHPTVTAFHVNGPVDGFAITEEPALGAVNSTQTAVLFGFAKAE